jgi:hypothetical protein
MLTQTRHIRIIPSMMTICIAEPLQNEAGAPLQTA